MIKSFKLGARTYKVKRVSHDSNNLGKARSPLGTIEIQKTWAGKDIPVDAQEETLYHEVFHCVLDQIGRSDLNEDESFVQAVAGMLYQFAMTAK